MTGLLRDNRLTIDVDDETLTALHQQGGKVFAVDSLGTYTAGELVHDGSMFVIRLETSIEPAARRTVKLKPRLVVASGAI